MQMVLHQLFRKKQVVGHCFALALFLAGIAYSPATSAQQNSTAAAGNGFIKNSFQNARTQQVFIENIGQYGHYMEGYQYMGVIKYGYEGLGMPVLFTPKGLIHLQRKASKLSHKEEENLEKAGAKEEEIEHQKKTTDRTITMEWVGANENAELITEDKSTDYHTYGLLTEKAYGYRKIIYKNIYPGIDVVYSFIDTPQAGFEYSLVAAPGADLSMVKMKYGGDVKSIKINNKGALLVRSDIDDVSITTPLSYYGKVIPAGNAASIKSNYKVFNNEISIVFPGGYDSSKTIILDPFVSSTSNLTGTFAGKAIDVDYDYAGNVYVAGGGSTNQTGTASHSHAKYNSAGVLLWTFNGVLSIPIWQAGYYYGGWVVDKASGALYIGQGFAFQGFQVVRISTTGLYDNYISTANNNFQEDWKMYWYCNNGNPQILCAGGGTTGNNNIAICTPPSTTLLASSNLTGAAAAYQDMSDLVIDPVTNSLYSIYASGLDKTIENRIFKHNAPYSAATTVWSAPSGYTVLGEILNRPYLGGSYADNSSNILAVNASYLFYWDGLNLKAMDKASGATLGALTLAGNLKLYQGGIVADACNNVFVGNTNGIIKVYKFNGTTFDDAAASDITIPGFSTNVYDLALDESKKLLYASGDGFVASFDVAAYCPTTNFTVNIVPNCLTASAVATISPAPPAGSTITYSLFNGGIPIGAANTSGLFTGLQPNITYTVVATVNLACSGTQASASFVLPGPTITFTQTNTVCGTNTGTITATGSGEPGPYAYSLNGGPFQPTGNYTGLTGGIYTLVVQGAGGCPNDTVINIQNSNGPVFTFAQTNATCGNNTGTVTVNAAGGTAPYQYSINGGTIYQAGNFFTGLTAGDYILVVKDAGGCTNRAIVTVISSPAVTLSAIPASATCGQNNGNITAFGSGGTAPLQYSINGNIFQAGNVFTGINPGVYTVTVRDAIGCTQTFSVTVDNVAPASVAATSAGATCGNTNGSITATGSNGIPPYQYSINGGVSFQTGNVFTGLAPGAYTITIKDATGCTGAVAVTVVNTNGPSVAAVTTTSSCAASTGTITASASGGAAPYQYSINGSTFFASNTFNALPQGNYVVFVKDNAGCIATVRVAVDALSGPTITAVAAPSSCTANNGSITATGTGGTAPLQYSTDGIVYGPGNIFTGLASALYTVYVKDVNGCIKTTTVLVGNASGLTLSVAAVTSSCSIGNGQITATATGGILPLQYSIDGISYQAGNVFTGLVAGPYTVYVKDANGCIVTKLANVSTVAGPSFSLTVLQNATCGTASGVIRVTASGGITPLSYSIDGGAFQPAPIFVNVAPGAHSIIVKDASGCTAAAQNSTITNSGSGAAITDVTFTVRDILACTGEGRIKNLKGFPSGGGNNYEFSLDGGPFTTANQFRPVSAGYHTITARNRTSLCSITKLVTIGVGSPATATATSTASACGASTGTITLTGVGANTPYHASIDNGITWQTFAANFTFTALAPATYPIIIADDADFTTGPPDVPGACLTTIFVTVPSTGGPAISTTQVNPACTVNTGSITATGSGGTGPYSYSVDAGPYTASGVFANLSPGSHAISVKDATGCTNGVSITLASAAVPTVTAQVLPTSCNLNNGTITATGTGGIAPLEYSINGTVYVASNIFTGLTPGSYTLYVRDANRCFSTVAVTINNTPFPKVTAYTIAAACNNNDGSVVAEGSLGQSPYTFSINGTAYQSNGNFSGLAAGFYTVYIKDAAGCISTTGVTVNNIGGPGFTTAITAAKCGHSNGDITVTATGGIPGYEYSSDGGITFQPGNILTLLAAGTYAVVVRDAAGCKVSSAVTIADIQGPQTLTAVITDASCGNPNGSITATVTGGTVPLQYSNDGVTYQAGNILGGVPAGNYTLYVKDANGCIKTLPVAIVNLQGPIVSATSSSSSCGASDGTITVLAVGGTVPLSYSKDGGLSFQPGNIFTGLAAGPYTIIIKDAKGCNSTATVTTVASFAGSSTVPTFSPVAPVCAGSVLAALPTTSLNGITGTWAPALNNTTTTTYTFTPSTGQCATTATLTITVIPAVIPVFDPVVPVCTGSTMAPLPTTSLNGIAGTWAPALNNTITTVYTFTPAAGQCATTASLTITVIPAVIPVFDPLVPVCTGSTMAPLPTTSLNSIGGTWAPALNNTATTTYTFTPAAGQCATTASLTITVIPAVKPAFDPVAPVCTGSSIAPLPTTSLNGIAGTWVPALNNTTTTTYTFTPSAGQCATAATLTITVIPAVIPAFDPVAPVCTGSTMAPLPSTSLNGITGTWAPALNNTITTIYTFTPAAGQCATTAPLTITVIPAVTPAFDPVAPVCTGSTMAPLPATSLNGITGTWAPALNNTATTTYTFTPAAGQCAAGTSLMITVLPILSPVINCGISTTSTINFTWAAVTGATGYDVLYQLGSGAIVNVGGIGNVLSYQVNGLSAGEIVTITITPTGGAGTCLAAATASCAATACTPPTASINYSSPFCANETVPGQVTLSGTGAFTGGLFSASPALTINSSTGAIIPATSTSGIYIVTYTVAGTGGCPGTTATSSVTINPLATPLFTTIAPVCQGSVIPALPAMSTNGISGTWSPALNNTSTTMYTFTPAAGQCAAPANLTITVIPGIIPLFDPVPVTCAGAAIAPLATSSTNGISGSWSPALNNLVSTTYTFTPVAGQCAAPTTLAITIVPAVIPAFDPVAPVCSGSLISPLPAVSLNGITGAWSPALNNAATTTYTFIPAAGQCAVATTLTIAVKAGPPAPSVTIVQPTCLLPGAVVTIGSGTTGLTFSIDGAGFTTYPTGGYTGLAAGSHTIYAKNSSGCISVVTNFIVDAASLPPSAVITTVTDASCGAANGSLTIGTITGGTAPFTFSIDGSVFTGTLVYTNLTAGSHGLIIKDNNGCNFLTGVAINNTGGATVSAVSTAATCGNSNGSVTATGSNGVAPYQYAVDGTSFQQANSFTGLAAGAHIVSIKDANNCINTVIVTIANTNGANVTAIVTDAGCGTGNGSITATGTGGTAPYQYSIDGTNFQSSVSFTGLAAGAYTLTIKDAAGCVNTIAVTVTSTSGAAVTAVATAAACGAGNGSITATGTGGTAPYQYSIDGTNFQSSINFTGLAAGAYTLTIKDAAGCVNSIAVTIANTNGANVTAIVTDAACSTGNGSITATGTGGTAPYLYSIDGIHFQAGNIFSGMAPANYIITIKDASGCTSSTTVSVGNLAGPALTAVAAAASCGVADGIITATGSGGIAPYQYSLNTVDFQPSNIFPGLAPGVFTVTVKDANGCTSTKTVTVNSGNTVTINAGTDISICTGASIQLNALSNAASYSWSPAAGLSNTALLNPVAAPLVTTAYIITATTGLCSKSDTVIVHVLPPPVAVAGNDASICFGQRLQLHGSGGNAFQWSPPAYLSVANNQNPVFFALQPGKFTLLLGVIDSNGCHSVKNDTMVITVLPPVAIFAGNDTSVAVNQPLQLQAVDLNNSGFVNYSWSPVSGLSNAFSKNPVFSTPNSNTITLHVTATTAEGCEATDDITVKAYIKSDLYVPNAFTPNGDGRNDVLKVIPVGIRELKFFTIYNRWGEIVFTTKNLLAGWDGIYKGQKQDSNTFVWVAEAVDFSGNLLMRKGVAILIR